MNALNNLEEFKISRRLLFLTLLTGSVRAVGMPAKVISSQGAKVSDTNLRKNSCY